MLVRNRISDRFTEGEGSQARYESRGGADESPVAAFQARFLLGAVATETIHEEKTKDLSGSRSEQRFDKRASVLQRELTDWRWKVGVLKVGKGESAV